MTWKQLVEEISLLTEEQKNTDVTVYVRGIDGFYPVVDELPIIDSATDDTLDPNHPFLMV